MTVLPGLDALCAGLAPDILNFLRGKRVGLLTNHTGQTREGVATLDALRQLDINIRALFSPEHGPAGIREGDVESGATGDGLPVYSLYGATRRPTDAMLANLDTLVCDLQDAGARFYTYTTTLAYCLEECAARNISVVVLDRPNPLGGEIIEGPSLDDACRSFVGYLRIPVRHGLTLGELARLHVEDEKLDLDLRLAPLLGWQRSMRWPDTGLTWPVPSPNLPDYKATAWYPGTCLLEFSGVSVGRGTGAPFQIVGAPWFDPARVQQAMKEQPLIGRERIQNEPVEFIPTRAIFAGEPCHGLRFSMADSGAAPCYPVSLGLALLNALYRAHPHDFTAEKLDAAQPLIGSSAVLQAIRDGQLEVAQAKAQEGAERFRVRREPFLLYS